MSHVLSNALRTREARALLAAGLKDHSTKKQVKNGTLHLAGWIRRRPVSIKITGTGAVISNEFVARQVFAESESAMYRAGLGAARELVAKRFGV